MLHSLDVAAASGRSSSPVAPLTTFLDLSKGNFETGDWSSLIGIITAICGNVLISIALNTQRYAHIKLSQQHQQRSRLWRKAQSRLNDRGGQGAVERGSGHFGAESPSPLRRKERTNREPRYRDIEEGNEAESEATEDQPLLSRRAASEEGEDVNEEADYNDRDDASTPKSYLKSPYWWTGIILMTVGEAGNFLAYGFAPASIVSPLGVVALISNCIIAPLFLKERFRKRDILGVVIAVGGAVTVVLSANDSNPKLGPDEIWKLIGTWEFETYLGTTVAVIMGLMWASSKYGDKSIFIDLGLVGLFGGYTALSTKGVASLLSYTLFKALTFPITYLLMAVLVFTAIMQIKYVNRALQRFDSTQVIPTQFVLFTLSVILGSAVLYRDFERESGEAAGKFIGGCAMTFLGVWLITSARAKEEEDDDEGMGEDEEAIRLASERVYQVDIASRAPDYRRHSMTPRSYALPVNGNRHPDAYGTSFSPCSTHDSDATSQLGSSMAQSALSTGGGSSDLASVADGRSQNDGRFVSPEDLTDRTRKSIQKLLKPLDPFFPAQDANKPLPSTLKTTTSEPILPNEAIYQPACPHTPQHIDAHLHTPQAAVDVIPVARHSITDLIPGPLTSTLSSPLSAIVADSLRRGVDPRSLRPKKKRKLPHIPRAGAGVLPQRNNSESDAGSRPLSDEASFQRPEPTSNLERNSQKSMPRSFSNALGDWFRSHNKVKSGSGREAEEGRTSHDASHQHS